jgi:hypothetical protein
MFADPSRLFYGLQRVYESLERDWGRDGGALRSRYASFLAEAQGLPGLARLEPGGYYELGERWSAFAEQVLADGRVPLPANYRQAAAAGSRRNFGSADPAFAAWAADHRADHFAALADSLEPILDAEQAAARKLAAAVGIT